MTLNAPSDRSGSLIELGKRALVACDWVKARKCFESAVEESPRAEAFEGLAQAASWLHDGKTAIEGREHALRLYLDRGDRRGAARMAEWLALDVLEFRGESVVAEGWLYRARRLLDGMDPSPELAVLTCMEAHFALMLRNDTETAIRQARQAHEMARQLKLRDLEALSLALDGLALVSSGKVAGGMRKLDEAGVALISGEVSDPNMAGTAYCYIVDACDRVRDYERAGQWCGRLGEFAEEHNLGILTAFCRPHHAVVLMWRGAWDEAEKELTTAIDDMTRIRQPMVVEGIVRLADLRLRQGKVREAATLLRSVEHAPLAQLTRADLALAEGDSEAAIDLADRYLRRLPLDNAVERAGGLDVMVRARVAQGDLEAAARYQVDFQETAAVVGTDPLRAGAAFSAGLLEEANGRWETARQRFEDAVDSFSRAGAVQETARARLGLARCLQSLGRVPAAIHEGSLAFDTLRKLGAALDADKAAALLRSLAASRPMPGSAASQASVLTPRESEILKLIALGKSNTEIATLMVLSVRTVERHISNIYGKTGASGKAARASATAYAFSHGLVGGELPSRQPASGREY